LTGASGCHRRQWPRRSGNGGRPVDSDALQPGHWLHRPRATICRWLRRRRPELIGNFTAAGREWEPQGRPTDTNVHDFVDKKLGKVAPYGVYDIAANTGWVNVGTDADTGQFAVESIRRWWNTMGASTYPDTGRLLITADSGGSNGSRLRLWKTELAALATETGLAVTVCHLPPGTSKWNKIEHVCPERRVGAM